MSLTKKQLYEMEPMTIFASGTFEDDFINGIPIENTGRLLRWVACRGEIPDWSIYVHFASMYPEQVACIGQKIYNPQIIKKLVRCDKKAFDLYRY